MSQVQRYIPCRFDVVFEEEDKFCNIACGDGHGIGPGASTAGRGFGDGADGDGNGCGLGMGDCGWDDGGGVSESNKNSCEIINVDIDDFILWYVAEEMRR